MPADFEAYFRSLATASVDEKTEHTDRAALEKLLQQAADDAGPGARVQHEPRRDRDGAGSPDFKIVRQGRIAGYVEVKTIDENLSKVLKSEQIKKYRKLSDNIVLTDYLEFCWITPDGPPIRHRLAYSDDLASRTIRLKPESVDAVRALLRGFFSTAPQKIAKGRDLALALASRAAMLRDFLAVELQRQAKDHQEGRLHALYGVFKSQIFHELTVGEFADAFAQMLAYGLFLARLNTGEREIVTLANVRQHIPGSFRLIRELVRFLEDLEEREYEEVRWVIDEVLSIVNGIDLAAIHADLSFRSRKAISPRVRADDEEEHRLFERDPFIYFYEDFLKAYDPAMRKGRGVYYTPPPVVNFIVRAVDDILKDRFGIRDGLANHKRVTVLDFACGTGTFLLEVAQQIFENIGGADSGRADLIVRDHITKNLFGFEYLIAPYTIAHLKLSQYLKDKEHPLKEGERLQVYLTNTLEPIEPQVNLLLPGVTAEVEAAQAIKDRDILVIMGNPPYSGHSKNKGSWITRSISKYREGFPDLSKPAQGKWLQDDYVKFIRFAQMKMETVSEGIVGLICNHSWIDNPTFKGMRKSLLETFDQIYVFDLHGSTKKREQAPSEIHDENVFDIEQGVAIVLFIKNPDVSKSVLHADLWGRRLTKYEAAAHSTVSSIDWTILTPAQPDWLLLPRVARPPSEYLNFWSVRDIFSPLGDPAPGIVTTHDEFAVSFTPNESRQKIRQFLSTETEADARKFFRLCTQEQWRYDRAKSELPHIDIDKSLTEIAYRPFDPRWTIWDRNVAVHRRERVMAYMRADNVALDICKVVNGRWHHAFVIDRVADDSLVSNRTKERGFVFPLFATLGESYALEFRSFVDSRYGHHYSPEEIFAYIYAVLYSRAYRSRFAEFLRADFPRIPFAASVEGFEALSGLGWALVQAHLLRDFPRSNLAAYHGKGDHAVEAVRYGQSDQAVFINKTQFFAPVPREIWNFEIGSYQVLHKYLKSRKGRTLSLDEINRVSAIADSLAFTIEQMAAIDEAYRAAIPERG